MSRSWITIVSGLPRSGTSLMMQMLAAGGVPLLTDNVRAPDESNPRGYFELEAVKRLRADQSWLPEAQGRAVKIIHALLRELPTDGRFEYRVLLMKRPIEQVLASQRAMLARSGKTSADEAMLTRVYQAQLADIETWLNAQPQFSVMPIEHRELLEKPLPVAEQINTFLGGDLDASAMSSVVDPLLFRQRAAHS